MLGLGASGGEATYGKLPIYDQRRPTKVREEDYRPSDIIDFAHLRGRGLMIEIKRVVKRKRLCDENLVIWDTLSSNRSEEADAADPAKR